jgi:hypothetical protein
MKKLILYICFLFVAINVTAQTPDDVGQQNPKRMEKIKALYVAFITQQLSLTPDEAQKFWPVHGQYDAELRATKGGVSDELEKQQAALNVKKKYQASFSKILGADRCNTFYKKDAEFRKRLVDKLKEMKQKRTDNFNNRKGPGENF